MFTVIASMEYELSGLRKELRSVASVAKEVGRHLGGPEALPDMVVIGVGKQRAQASVRRLLESKTSASSGNGGQPHGLLLLGVAGGIDPDLDTGNLVLSSRYLNGSQIADDWGINYTGGDIDDALAPDPLMWHLATQAGSGEGRNPVLVDSLTVDQVISAPEHKRWIAGAYPVGIVEMEDYWVAQVAAEFGVGFLAARVVLDTADQALPGWLLGLSRSKTKAALSLAVRPWRIPAVLRLARQRPVAQRMLTRFALRFLAEAARSTRNPLTSIVDGQSGPRVTA